MFIRSLDIGGAERQLVALATGLHKEGMDVRVLSFYSGGALRAELHAAGVPVSDLGKHGRWDVLTFFFRLVRVLRIERPEVLYGFLPVANILSALVKPFVPGIKVIWGVRASEMDLSRYDWLSRRVAYMECRLARFADRIVANSEAGRTYHIAQGFPAGSIIVIPNGIDTGRFHFDAEGRRRVRAEWGVRDDEILIGVSARLDPMKGYETFLEAVALLAQDWSHVRFACVGEGSPVYRERLVALARRLGIADRVVWPGCRHDMPSVYSAFDIASSSSYGEGFSNAIAEAMSCERPCVVSDVGDSAWIVGKAGRVVPAREAKALARAWRELLDMPADARHGLGIAARRRIEELASIQGLVQRTIRVFQE